MADFNNPFGNNATKKDGEDKAIEWGDTIAWEDAPEYVVLPPGNYEFTVMNWDRGHYEGNPATGKIACNTARVTVAVETDKGTAYAKYTFYLHRPPEEGRGVHAGFRQGHRMQRYGTVRQPPIQRQHVQRR